ncbi:MAG: sel1 repeat family protein [Blautia sp.]|nr:sel1 repeat family protein [Blautia sp.]
MRRFLAFICLFFLLGQLHGSFFEAEAQETEEPYDMSLAEDRIVVRCNNLEYSWNFNEFEATMDHTFPEIFCVKDGAKYSFLILASEDKAEGSLLQYLTEVIKEEADDIDEADFSQILPETLPNFEDWIGISGLIQAITDGKTVYYKVYGATDFSHTVAAVLKAEGNSEEFKYKDEDMMAALADVLYNCRPVPDDEPEKEEETEKVQELAEYTYQQGETCFNEKKDYQTALKWYLYSASLNLTEAEYKAGYTCYFLAASADDKKTYSQNAVKWLSKAADKGNAQAQYQLGYMYRFGMYVEKNYETAAKWLQLAAEAGNDEAQNALGEMYSFGNGVPKDREKAEKWYSEAAGQGNVNALFHLGSLYYFYEPKDYTKAISFLELAAEKESSGAQKLLGDIYRDGQGVPVDLEAALKWYRKSAENNNKVGRNELGVMYRDGLGVAVDFAEAAKWFQAAADQGNEDAQKNLEDLQERGIG